MQKVFCLYGSNRKMPDWIDPRVYQQLYNRHQKKKESSLHTGINIKDKCCKSIALTQLSEEINSSCGQAFEDHKMAGCNSCGKHSKVFYFIGQWRRLRKNRRTFKKTTLKASCLQNEQVHFILTTLCSPPNLMPVVKHSYTV